MVGWMRSQDEGLDEAQVSLPGIPNPTTTNLTHIMLPSESLGVRRGNNSNQSA